MRKILILIIAILVLSGCAVYKFHRGREPYHKGYVVSRDDYTILEYTVGRDNSVPNRAEAKERFKRRRKVVERYYKKMGYVENHFKMVFFNPVIIFVKIVGGVFRLPFIAVSDYKYRHNPEYREKIKKIEAEKDAREEAKIKKLKDELNTYIQSDLSRESSALTR